MANFTQDQQYFVNGVKGYSPIEQFFPYQVWSQQYPGYTSNPWYPPFNQNQSHPIQQEIIQHPDLKQEMDEPLDLKTETNKTLDPGRDIDQPLDLTLENDRSDDMKQEFNQSLDVEQEIAQPLDLKKKMYLPFDLKQETEYPQDFKQPLDLKQRNESFDLIQKNEPFELKQEIEYPHELKPRINQLPDVNQERSHNELYTQIHSQTGLPLSEYPSQHTQHGAFQFSTIYPSNPTSSFTTNNYSNPNAYNPMPEWNQSGQFYKYDWDHFQQPEQKPQICLQNDTGESKEFQHKENGDNSIDTAKLDSSSEVTSDLGSSLNNSSFEESPQRYSGSTKCVSSKKYTEWKEDNLTLLAGWKKRSYQQGRKRKKIYYQYMSPSLEIFERRSQMVEHLKLTGHSEESVAKVVKGSHPCRSNKTNVVKDHSGSHHGRFRDSNQTYEWFTDESLPSGWKRRSTIWKNGNKYSKKYTYLAPDNRIFNSRTEIVSFMRNSNEFTEEDVQKALSGSGQGKAVRSVPSVAPGSRRKDPNLLYNDWTVDETLPNGWKKRFIEFKNGPNKMGKKFTYLAPNNQIFNSRTEIVSFMRNSVEFNDQDVRMVLSGSRAGIRDPNQLINWINDETLPLGWKKSFKEWKNGDKMSKKYTYFSPDYRVFNSRTEVVSFMRNSGEYSENEIEKALSGNLQGRGPKGKIHMAGSRQSDF